MKKRWLCGLLCAALLLCCLPVAVSAAEFDRTGLDAALEEAAGYLPEDYTEETWAPFEEALQDAKDLATLLSPVPEDDYVVNGSFESGTSDIPNDWVSDEGAPLKQGWNPAHTGNFIVSRVWTAEEWYDLPYGGTQTVTIPQDGVYRISGWINGTIPEVLADSYFAVEDEEGNKVLTAEVLEGAGESDTWNEHAAEGFLEAGTYVVHFYIHTKGMPQTDDVSLKMVAWPGYDELTQPQIDEVVEALNDKMDALVRRPTDKSDLQSEIARADGMDEDDYTPNTWVNVAPKLEAAKTVNGNQEARQSEIDTATAELKAVLDALVKRADVTALSAAIQKAESLQKSDYMPSTWYAMQAVLEPAKTVLADLNVAQADVDTAAKDLEAGIAGLVKKPAPGPDDPATPGDVNGDGQVNSTDARMVLQHTVSLMTLTPEQQARADINDDGNIDSSDARAILTATVA